MASDDIETELHAYHGWPIRVSCETQGPDGMFAARSFVTPGGQAERATPGAPFVCTAPDAAKALALKAARKYIDGILVD